MCPEVNDNCNSERNVHMCDVATQIFCLPAAGVRHATLNVVHSVRGKHMNGCNLLPSSPTSKLKDV